VSELRRVNQAKRTMPALGVQVASIMRAHWRKILGLIGVPTLYDLVREFARAKAMEWIYQHLGSFGVWMASYKLAGLTMGIIVAILWVVVSIFKETRARTSVILDPTGNPYQIRVVSKAWARSALAVSCALVGLLIYGTYRFYVVTPEMLLKKYPLGYVVFDVDHKNSVFPYDTIALDKWDFDWSVVGYKQYGNELAVRFPNIRPKQGPGPIITNARVNTPKKVGALSVKVFFSDGVIDLTGEILAIRKNGIVFVIGFTKAS
jgi:hypothetical protein